MSQGSRARTRGERTSTTSSSSDVSHRLNRSCSDLHTTIGIHPTSTSLIPTDAIAASEHFGALEQLILSDLQRPPAVRRVRAVGEVGLDYDRLKFAARPTQLEYLPHLLQLGKKHRLPLFLHSRTPESHVDLVRVLLEAGWPADGLVGWQEGREWVGGVVHSFTGSAEEAAELVSLPAMLGHVIS